MTDPILTPFDQRWRAFELWLSRSLGQKGRAAKAKSREQFDAAYRELGLERPK